MADRDKVLEILRKAFQIEVDGYTFYSMTAERADKPAVQELFAKLASDEVQHQAFLKNVATHYDERGVEAFQLNLRSPEIRAMSQAILTGDFRDKAAVTQFELGVLSIGMTLETNAVRYFSDAAKQASEKEVKEFYEFLANWEKQHFEALQQLHTAVRADFWHDSSFAPF